MIRVLATGVLHADPVVRTSANGNPYTTAKLRTDDGKGGSVWCNLGTQRPINQRQIVYQFLRQTGDFVVYGR